jgi:hypothetical protein
MGLVHRFSAVVLCLGLVAGNAAICAGWASTPEARMACCTDGAGCPMHKDDTAAPDVVTQAQADACCASAERESSPSAPTFVAAIWLAVLGPGTALPMTVPALVLSDDWRTVSPPRPVPVPRHVLLSVFLL